MGLPITYLSPFIQTAGPTDGKGSHHKRRDRSKQAKPYDLPAKYWASDVHVDEAVLYGTETSYGGQANAGAVTGDYTVQPLIEEVPVIKKHIDWATFRARECLLGELNEMALLATNWIERHQAAGMMANRLFQLYDFARAVKRGDLRSASHILGDEFRPSKGRARSVGNVWLEYHFGWEPLIHDIYNACTLLSDPLPGGYYSTSQAPFPPGKIRFSELLTSSSGGSYKTTHKRTVEGWVKAKAGAEFYVTNPNLYLAARLGLNNPAAIAWEAIPFSFIVDWFTTVGAFIGQYSELQGLTVRNAWYSWKCGVTGKYERKTVQIATGSVVGLLSVGKTGFYSKRSLGIPAVTLRVRPAKRLSLVRAATAISLLLNFLPKPKRPDGWAEY